MRLLKTHSHLSKGLAMEQGTRKENQLKETQTLQQGKPPLKTLPRSAGVVGGVRRKRLYGKTNHRKRHYARANHRRNEEKHRR